ncbi:hypothetical protein Vadar_010246 [Vaccinium darrowii]|uniref:Uncharacterized protein n=1 Tax=Vaccinium darrowii TaxID=229202 RepID=A0ACB7ZAS4_9ERIC|nr:hypothetical protein Vadar_010246 [Vaccinium darrowii]
MKPINKSLAILALLFLLSMFNTHEAARVLNEESLILQSLQRGTVPPSGPSNGRYTPGTSTLGQKGFAGCHTTPLPLPQLMATSGATTS